jgi:catechol 2,3-dioxygenase-like lactoylglutathione lyase family enzyme
MSGVQLALRVADLDGSVEFYSKLFNATPAKRRPGYANFAIAEPPLKLVLLEGEPGEDTRMDHLGVEVENTDLVTAATNRLADAGLATRTEDRTTCCYAVQDKVWVTGPGKEPWEVYTVTGDARPDLEGKTELHLSEVAGDATCCTTDAVPDNAADPDRAVAGKAACC